MRKGDKVKMIKVTSSEEFLKVGTFLVTGANKEKTAPHSYLILNFHMVEDLAKELLEFKERNSRAYGYTLQNAGGNNLVLVEGLRNENRIGYYVTVEEFKFEGGELEF